LANGTDGDRETPLIEEKDCAYVIYDGKTALCGIEQAYNQGVVDWKKPVSCHLYPIRVKDFTEFAAVNYDQWDICDDACTLGKELEVPVYKFVKEALIRRFGEDWYAELESRRRTPRQSTAKKITKTTGSVARFFVEFS
jgi:hypothetical protein